MERECSVVSIGRRFELKRGRVAKLSAIAAEGKRNGEEIWLIGLIVDGRSGLESSRGIWWNGGNEEE